jgi:hypothetical protein
VFFLRRVHADRQPRRRPERHFREDTTAESGDGFDGGFVEALGWNPNGVLDASESVNETRQEREGTDLV